MNFREAEGILAWLESLPRRGEGEVALHKHKGATRKRLQKAAKAKKPRPKRPKK